MSCLPSGQGWRQPAGAESQLRSLPKVKPKSHSSRQICSKQLGAAETYCNNMAHGAVAKHVNCGEACIEQESGWLQGRHNLGKALSNCLQSSDSCIPHQLGRLCC